MKISRERNPGAKVRGSVSFAGEVAGRLVGDGPRVSQSNQCVVFMVVSNSRSHGWGFQQSASVVAFLHFVQDILNAGGGRFLPGWEFSEALKEPSHDGLRR